MYGGWTLAVMLRAAEVASNDEVMRPASMTANFVRPIEAGSALSISVRAIGGTRSVRLWETQIAPESEEGTCATASVLLLADRPSDGHLEVSMPEDAPEPESLGEFHPPGSQGQQVVIRPISGLPPYRRPDTYSTAWVRDVSGRRVDYQGLAYLADQRAPRSFHWSDGPRPSATLTMSVYFHATREELARVGDDYLFSEAFGVKGAWSNSEEHHRLWSRNGDLLATSVQLARYR
jgi:acyl-CoA thioesterase